MSQDLLNTLIEIKAPETSNAYGTGVNEVFDNIDKNFQTIASAEYLKGADGNSVEIEIVDIPAETKNADVQESSTETREGYTGLYIYDLTQRKYIEITHSYIKQLIRDVIQSKYTLEKLAEVNGIDRSIKFDDYLKKGFKIVFIYKTVRDENRILKVPISSLAFPFIDLRFAEFMPDYKDQYKSLIDCSCAMQWDGDTFVINDVLPTLYYNGAVGNFCWKINGYESGIIANGPQGAPGEKGNLKIVKASNLLQGSDHLYQITDILVGENWEPVSKNNIAADDTVIAFIKKNGTISVIISPVKLSGDKYTVVLLTNNDNTVQELSASEFLEMALSTMDTNNNLTGLYIKDNKSYFSIPVKLNKNNILLNISDDNDSGWEKNKKQYILYINVKFGKNDIKYKYSPRALPAAGQVIHQFVPADDSNHPTLVGNSAFPSILKDINTGKIYNTDITDIIFDTSNAELSSKISKDLIYILYDILINGEVSINKNLLVNKDISCDTIRCNRIITPGEQEDIINSHIENGILYIPEAFETANLKSAWTKINKEEAIKKYYPGSMSTSICFIINKYRDLIKKHLDHYSSLKIISLAKDQTLTISRSNENNTRKVLASNLMVLKNEKTIASEKLNIYTVFGSFQDDYGINGDERIEDIISVQPQTQPDYKFIKGNKDIPTYLLSSVPDRIDFTGTIAFSFSNSNTFIVQFPAKLTSMDFTWNADAGWIPSGDKDNPNEWTDEKDDSIIAHPDTKAPGTDNIHTDINNPSTKGISNLTPIPGGGESVSSISSPIGSKLKYMFSERKSSDEYAYELYPAAIVNNNIIDFS